MKQEKIGPVPSDPTITTVTMPPVLPGADGTPSAARLLPFQPAQNCPSDEIDLGGGPTAEQTMTYSISTMEEVIVV